MRDRRITVDEARELVADQTLWPLVRDFLWDFTVQMHPSWIEGAVTKGADPAGGAEAVGSTAAMREIQSPRMKRFILGELGIEPCFHDFPRGDWSRLLLLDRETLESVVKWLGALVCAEALRRVTGGSTVRELKSALPGVYPEVFGFTAYFSGVDFHGGDAAQIDFSGNCDVVAKEGSAVLLGVLSGLPEALVSRLKFKLPKTLCASEPMRVKNETDSAVVAKLLKLKFPEAYKLCC